MAGRSRAFFGVLCCTAIFCGMDNAEKTQKPEETVRSMLESVRVLAEAKDKEEEARKAREVSENLDLQDIAKSCLRETWNTLPETERTNFTSLFREILEKVAYPKSAKFFKGTEIEVDPARVEAGTARVDTVVTHPEEGLVEVTYRLGAVAGKWLIRDVELDGVSLVLDLRSQMQKILREKSYQELKRRIREKIEEG